MRLLVLLVASSLCAAAQGENAGLAEKIRAIDSYVGTGKEGWSGLLADDVQRRTVKAGALETSAWKALKSKADWEVFRDVRIKALRDSLGPFPEVPRGLNLRVTRTLSGDGYSIQNLVYETRPGLFVSANLYLPAKPRAAGMPGILLSHSHHAPKTEGELQDMGMNWARMGCAVLVPDHLGHGERRQHPFVNAESYAGSFKPSRQDYYFRYNEAMQLHLAGESLMGWMVWDLMRGVDVLLAQKGIDREKIILIGSVAGGGDPAGITAALDPRIAAVVPFNFGGPQPDDPIPANAERDFLYFGSPWWESTRCLRLGARDGFAHWMIAASVAPRRLIYSCEFVLQLDRDPVWPRIEQVFDWYGAADHLATAHGRGSLKGKPPESSHCNNVGPVQRAQLYPTLQKWFGIEPPAKENQTRRKTEELICFTPEVLGTIKPRRLFELAGEIGAERAGAVRVRLENMSVAERRVELRKDWAKLLGIAELNKDPGAQAASPRILAQENVGEISIVRLAFEPKSGVVIPILVLIPPHPPDAHLPVIVAFAQGGKQQFLRQRSEALSNLLSGGVIVCLSDLRGTGETAPKGRDRGRGGELTSVSQAELMLGQTLLGERLGDLQTILRYLRSRGDVDAKRLALWGDSFAAANPPGSTLEVPLDADKFPAISEPMGASLVLLAMLFDDDIRLGYGFGGLAGFQSCLQSPYCYFPHDAVVPGALYAGDLGDVAAVIAPRPLRLAGLVDGLNQRVSAKPAAAAFEPTSMAYRNAGAAGKFNIDTDDADQNHAVTWMLQELKQP